MEQDNTKTTKQEAPVNNKSDKKVKKEKKESASARVWSFVKEDHPFENWLLFILALILLVLGLYILVSAASDKNDFADNYFDISKSGWGIFDKTWKVIVISSVVIAIAAGVIVYTVFPVFKPSFKEMKFVTWTNKKTLFLNSVTVLVFIIFLTVLFWLFDLALIPLFNLIFGA